VVSLTEQWRHWRRRLKAALPYVRRREYRVLERNYAALVEAADGVATPAAEAGTVAVKPFDSSLAGELALFVSFADGPALKPHVGHHIERLTAHGIRVRLIVNTAVPAHELRVEPALLAKLDGLWVRQNTGFDFGAWAHALHACPDRAGCERLFLINDSIVGPLDDEAYARLLARVRASTADVLGLTEGLNPQRHLQSYFLVLQGRALTSRALGAMWARVRNWPTKGQVIDIYERRLTGLALADGLGCETLFPSLSGDPLASDDTSLRWAELVAAGFPFVKARVIAAHRTDPTLQRLLASAGPWAQGMAAPVPQ